MESFKFKNIEIVFQIDLNKFNRCKLLVKVNNKIIHNISILDSEMLLCVRQLHLFRNEYLTYLDIIKILDKNIDSNNLL